MKIPKALLAKMEDAVEQARDEAGPDDFGFNEEDGFIVGVHGFYGHNRIRNWEKRKVEWRKALLKEAAEKYPNYVPLGKGEAYDYDDTFIYSPEEQLEDDGNAFIMVMVPKQ